MRSSLLHGLLACQRAFLPRACAARIGRLSVLGYTHSLLCFGLFN